MIPSTSASSLSALQPRSHVLAGKAADYQRPPLRSLDGIFGEGNLSRAEMDRIVAAEARKHVSYGINIKKIGSATYERVRTEGREPTQAEHDQINTETKEFGKALLGFRKAGVADPLAAAREAVAKTRAQQFDSRNEALADVVQSFDLLFRGVGAISGHYRSTAAAESVRDGASADQLAVINHVVARNNNLITRIGGRMNVTTAMLERDYAISGAILSYDDSGTPRMGAFELSHEKYGKLLSVDEAGNATVYDQNGGGLDTTAYVNTLFGSDSVFRIASNIPCENLIDQRM